MSKAIASRKYRHYKKETMIYTVVTADALDCESVKPLVVYRPITPREPYGCVTARISKAR